MNLGGLVLCAAPGFGSLHTLLARWIWNPGKIVSSPPADRPDEAANDSGAFFVVLKPCDEARAGDRGYDMTDLLFCGLLS